MNGILAMTDGLKCLSLRGVLLQHDEAISPRMQ